MTMIAMTVMNDVKYCYDNDDENDDNNDGNGNDW